MMSKNTATPRKIFLAIHEIFLALLPAVVFTVNYVLIWQTYVGIAFLFIWLSMIGSVCQFTEKNHVTARLLRETEIAFFLLPISSIVSTFVTGAKVIGETQGDLQQAGAAIGTAIGGVFLVGLTFVIGLFGGLIMHVLTGRYGKDAANE